MGAGPAGAAVAGPILKMAPGATHGKWASRKLFNTLGLYTKQQSVQFMLLHSKNVLEIISEDPNIKKKFWWSMPSDWAYAIYLKTEKTFRK